MWFDTHCHLQYPGLPDDAVALAVAAGVGRMVCVGTDTEQSEAAIAAARASPDLIWATAGLHPHDAVNGAEPIRALLDAPEVVAVGECGLDYHYDHSPRHIQRAAFAAQVEMASQRDLALVIHTREAWDDTFAVLSEVGVPARTVLHCFTGGAAEARRALDIGAWLSFSGILTFKTAEDLREAAAMAPLDRILVETDAPYLAPVPHRGSTNHPALVTVVGEALAQVRAVEASEIEAATWDNAMAVFAPRR